MRRPVTWRDGPVLGRFALLIGCGALLWALLLALGLWLVWRHPMASLGLLVVAFVIWRLWPSRRCPQCAGRGELEGFYGPKPCPSCQR